MLALKECPFCGGDPETSMLSGANGLRMTVHCKHCCAEQYVWVSDSLNTIGIPFYTLIDGIDAACKKWNERFPAFKDSHENTK